jgi:hypothetical protein
MADPAQAGSALSQGRRKIYLGSICREAPKRFDDQQRRTKKESSYVANARQVSRTVGSFEGFIG